MARDPFNPAKLQRLGIKRTADMRFRCAVCGETWSPEIQPGGKLPKRWWRCPEECNADLNAVQRSATSETVRTTVILPAKLYERLGIAAVQDRKPAAELIRDALEFYLDGREDALREINL